MKDYKELANALREWSVAVDNGELDGTEDGMLASNLMIAADTIEELTNESLSDDGTLFVETDYDMAKIGRIHVRKRGTHAGGMFYVDKPLTPWISVNDRLPEKGQVVIACGKKSATSGMFQGISTKPEYWRWKGNTIKTVNYWMPLPEPPKGEEE